MISQKGYRAHAILRAKQRQMRKRFHDWDEKLAINYRYFRSTYPRASSVLCKVPIA